MCDGSDGEVTDGNEEKIGSGIRWEWRMKGRRK